MEVLNYKKQGMLGGQREGWGAGECWVQDKTGAASKAPFPRVSCQGQSSAMGCVLHKSPQRRNEGIGLMPFVLKETASGSCVQERPELSRQAREAGAGEDFLRLHLARTGTGPEAARELSLHPTHRSSG